MANFVQLYKSTDTSAPVLTGQVNSLCSLLTTVLVNGYTTAALSGITRSGTTATATLSVANTSLVTGNYVTIAGADQAGYNGVVQVTMLSTTQFTYTVTNGLTTPATTSSAFSYRKAPLGWSAPFTSGNTSVFRSNNINSPRHYLQVIDNGATAGGATEAQARAFEAMTDAVTGTQAYPTTTQQTLGLCWRKSATADSTARAWAVVGDDKTFWLLINSGGTTGTSEFFGFGWFSSVTPGDTFNSFVVGLTLFNSSNTPTGFSTTPSSISTAIGTGLSGWYIARTSSRIGGSFAPGICNYANSNWGTTQSNTNLANGAFYVFQPIIGETVYSQIGIRGKLPGLYNSPNSGSLTHYEQINSVVNLPSTVLVNLLIKVGAGSSGSILVDPIGPWT